MRALVCIVALALAAGGCHHGPASAVRSGVHETKCGVKNAGADARDVKRDPKCN